MTEPEPLDRYLDDFGRSLRTIRPKRRRRVVAVGVAAPVLAAAVLALVVLGGRDAARPVDAVAAARAAVASRPGEVVHLKLSVTTTGVGGLRLAARVRNLATTEQWASAKPLRWRIVERIPAGRGLREPLRTELAFAGGAQSSYDAGRRRLYVREGLSERGPAARLPGLFGTDPQQTILGLLRSGRAVDLGLVQRGRREVRRLRVERRSRGRLSDVMTYDVDPRTSAPVGGEVRTILPFRPRPHAGQALELIRRFHVLRYERLPLNPTTGRLLTIRAPADATVERVTAVEAARRIAKQAARCTTRTNGVRVCRSR